MNKDFYQDPDFKETFGNGYEDTKTRYICIATTTTMESEFIRANINIEGDVE